MPDPLHKLAKIVNDSCRYPANEVGAFLDSVAADAARPVVVSYRHRPAPSGLHAKFLAELSERSPYIVKRDPNSGLPGSVWVVRENAHGPNDLQWSGHRDSMPRHFRGAADPNNLLTRPASD